jgi:hypothetical protein
MDPFDKPEHVEAVNAFMERLDSAALAGRVNAVTGTTLTPKNTANLARLVCLAALKHRGRAIRVAGLGAQWNEGTLVLFVGEDFAEAEMP